MKCIYIYSMSIYIVSMKSGLEGRNNREVKAVREFAEKKASQ